MMSLITFLLGLLLGNWLAIGRDKRKEFNDAVTPIRSWLLAEKAEPSPYRGSPSSDEMDLFFSYLRPWQKSSFQRHLERFRDACRAASYKDSVGQVFYKNDAPAIQQELAAMLKYVDRR